MTQQPGLAGELELWRGPVVVGGGQRGVLRDQFGQWQQADAGHGLFPEGGFHGLVQAEHHQIKVPGMLRQRPVEGEAAAQV
jgi:hypothetical protein